MGIHLPVSSVNKSGIQVLGTASPLRDNINFLGGVAVADNPLNNSTDITVPGGTCEINFSIDQKEDTEDSEYDNQIKAQTIPYGSKFTSITSGTEKLHRLEVVNVPADSHEITYTGSWSNSNSTNYLFGRLKNTTTAGDTAVFGFTGVSCSIGVYTGTSLGYWTAELSTDGGVTWIKNITMTTDGPATVNNLVYSLYSGLTFGSYQVRITLIKTEVDIAFFSYQTYMVQKPITQYALEIGGATSIADVPPATSLISGSNIPENQVYFWNATSWTSNTSGQYIEFKFYGKYIWVQYLHNTSYAASFGVLIDGVATSVKTTPLTPSVNLGGTLYTPMWVRLDNGTLSDGVHTIKLSKTNAVYSQISGWGWYSALADSTLCHDLILGESSYVVGIDAAGFAVSGAGWGAIGDATDNFLRRHKVTTGNTDYFTFTTPNNANLKAIYAVMTQYTDRGKIKITLGASNTRYLNLDTNNSGLSDTIVQLYDSTVDAITLHNKQLKIEKVDGSYMAISGLIFEIWGTDKVGTNSIKVMQKWSRYNASTNLNTPVSNSYRFSVSGLGKTGQDALPGIHSGWVYGNYNQAFYTNLGVSRDDVSVIQTNRSGSAPIKMTYAAGDPLNYSGADYGYLGYSTRPEILAHIAGSTNSAGWFKFKAQLKRVI